MKNRYEALLILDIKGKEDTLKEAVDRLEAEFRKLGAEVESIQKMDKRQFTYVAGRIDAGHYVNFIFKAEPGIVDKLQAHFRLDPEVYRQNYLRLPAKKAAPRKERVAKTE
jgi:small subunit ribosomal protein S6